MLSARILELERENRSLRRAVAQAIGGNGAVTPAGASFVAQNSAAAGTSGYLNSMQAKLLAEQVNTAKSQTALNSAQAVKAQAEADSVRRENVIGDHVLPYAMDARASKLNSEITNNQLTHDQAFKGVETLMRLNDEIRARFGMNFDEYLAHLDLDQRRAVLRKAQLDNEITALDLPRASAEAGMWRSTWGKEVAPYAASAESVSRIFGNSVDALNPLRRFFGGSGQGLKVPRR